LHKSKHTLALRNQTLIDQLSAGIQRLADSSNAELLVSDRLVNRLVRELLATVSTTLLAS